MKKDGAYDRVIKMMEAVINDRTVPRNIRNAVEEAKKEVQREGIEEEVKLATAVQILDEITNDPNMPLYTRTQIWNIVTQLEELRRIGTKK
ncbi:MAG: UPF0147 family protein [Candidatus Aenigmarchaeota archaeon]|nr:UPF0147 family protein [Candidatus Aenigmarchaeota archaeon]